MLIQADDFFQQLVGLAGAHQLFGAGKVDWRRGVQAEQAGGEVAGALGPGAGVALLRHRFDEADFQATALKRAHQAQRHRSQADVIANRGEVEGVHEFPLPLEEGCAGRRLDRQAHQTWRDPGCIMIRIKSERQDKSTRPRSARPCSVWCHTPARANVSRAISSSSLVFTTKTVRLPVA